MLAQRLGEWLGWTGAVALSAALAERPAHAEPPAPLEGPDPAERAARSAPPQRTGPAGPAGPAVAAAPVFRTGLHARAAADLQQVQTALSALISAGPDLGGIGTEGKAPADFAPWRAHCHASQQAMQQSLAALRQRLRQALAKSSPAGARLAAIDAVLEPALAAQDRTLLGLLSLRLQAHFQRLQRAAGRPADVAVDDAWLLCFRADMNLLLQAELAHRLGPTQGLLDSLNPHPRP